MNLPFLLIITLRQAFLPKDLLVGGGDFFLLVLGSRGGQGGFAQHFGILVRVEALDDGRGTENGAGDAVVAGPTSVAALNFAHPAVHFFIPAFPGFSPGDDQRFAGHEVAEEFLAPVVPKPRKQGVVVLHAFCLLLVLDNGLSKLLGLFLSYSDLAQVLGSRLRGLWKLAFLFGLVEQFVGFPSFRRGRPLSSREGIKFDSGSGIRLHLA